MTVQLPTDLQEFVSQQVSVGTYRDEAELMIEAVRRMRDGALHYQALQKEVQAATARIERGEGIVLEGDDALGRFFDEIEAEVEQEIASKHASQS